MVELVNVPHVVFLLESDVDQSLRDVFADAVKEFGFTNNDLQLWCEVHGVDIVFAEENFFLQKADRDVGVIFLPIEVDLVLILSIKLFSKLNVLFGNFFACVSLQETFLSLEFVNWTLYPTHYAAGPCYTTRFGWHILGNSWILTVLLEKLIHLSNLIAVTIEDINVLGA